MNRAHRICFSPQLDGAADFEERRMIRAALRDLLKKKRGKTLAGHIAEGNNDIVAQACLNPLREAGAGARGEAAGAEEEWNNS